MLTPYPVPGANLSPKKLSPGAGPRETGQAGPPAAGGGERGDAAPDPGARGSRRGPPEPRLRAGRPR